MRHLWADHVPRVADYWASFSASYRQRVTELVDRYTPEGGSIIDFGCGVGVQAFLIRQRRPDILIYGYDCNPFARNYARVLCGPDERLHLSDTPVHVEEIPQVDTLVAIYTCGYLEPTEVGRVMTALRQKSTVMILAEPTALENTVYAYSGMPSVCYAYPYIHWFRNWGDQVDTEPIEADGFLNAITVVVKVPQPVELALEQVP